MIKKFRDFFKSKEVESVPEKIDIEHLRGFIVDVIEPLRDVDGVDLRSNSLRRMVPNSDPRTMEFKFTIKFSRDIDDEGFISEMSNIISHLKSEDLYLIYDTGKKIKEESRLKSLFDFKKHRIGGGGIANSVNSDMFWIENHFFSVVHNSFDPRFVSRLFC